MVEGFVFHWFGCDFDVCGGGVFWLCVGVVLFW